MNKKLFTFTFLLFITATTHNLLAENGVRVGIDYSCLDSKKYRSEWKWGYNVGLLHHFKISNNFGIQAELSYCTKGGIYTKWAVDPNDLRTILGEVYDVKKESYIELPILTRFEQHLYRNQSVSLLAGFHISYLIDAKEIMNEDNKLGIIEITRDDEYLLNKIDYGLIYGIEYAFTIFNMSLFIDFRHNIGLRTIEEKSHWNGEYHHNLVLSSFGVRF